MECVLHVSGNQSLSDAMSNREVGSIWERREETETETERTVEKKRGEQRRSTNSKWESNSRPQIASV